jgi:exodeoxyribonuclease X
LLLEAHSARQDVNNCLLLLDAILKKVGDPETWEAVWQLSEEARVPDVMPFGKHRGTRIADIPSDYKAWLLRQPDVDPYLVKALRGQR